MTRITWHGKELTGWKRKAAIAAAMIYVPIALIICILIGAALAPFAVAFRLVTGHWPKWFKLEIDP